MVPGAEGWAVAVVVVAAAVAAVVVAVVVFVRDCSCPRSYAQKSLCSLALLVESEPGDTPEGTTNTETIT